MKGTSSISAAARGRWGRGEEEGPAKTEYKLLVLSLLVYLWGSELYNFFPFSPNIVSGVLVVCALALVYLKNLTHSRALMIVACGLMMLYTVAKAEDMAENFNAALRIVTLLMTFWLIADREALADLSVAVESIHRAVFVTVLVLSALTLLELMLPSCYVSGLEKGGWGEGSFFVGFTRWPHTAASNTVFLFSLNLAYLLNCDFRPAELVLVAIPTLAVLQSGARVYLVPLGVLIVFYYLFKLKVRGVKSRWVVLAVLCLGVVLAFMKTGMLGKFAATTEGVSANSDNFLFAFTNSRTLMWDNLGSLYTSGSLLEKFLGHGFDYAEAQMNVGAHNDILYMLVSTGILGCALYCATVAASLGGLWISVCKGKKGGVAVVAMMAAYTLFPVLMNGLYNNPHLVFSNAVAYMIVFKGLSAATCEPIQKLPNADSVRSANV